MKPTNSRAIAIVMTLTGLPLLRIRWYLRLKRSCAFQACSTISSGKSFQRLLRVTDAQLGAHRYLRAASTNNRRTRVFPILLIAPRLIRLPEEDSEGNRPRYAIKWKAFSNLENCTISATIDAADHVSIPRSVGFPQRWFNNQAKGGINGRTSF